ncbi:unnamed protein product [Ectocarpus sp. 8 AP-2014]
MHTASERFARSEVALEDHIVWARLKVSKKKQPSDTTGENHREREMIRFDNTLPILSVKTLVAELHEDPSVDLDFYVDIHAHSVGTNSFMYGNNIPARRKGFATASSPSSSSPSRRSEADSGASTPSWPQPTPVPSPQRQPPRDQQTGTQAPGNPSTPSPRQTTPTSASSASAVSAVSASPTQGPLKPPVLTAGAASPSLTPKVALRHSTSAPAAITPAAAATTMAVATEVERRPQAPRGRGDSGGGGNCSPGIRRKNKPREREEGGGCSSNGKVRSSIAVARGKAAGELIEDDDTTAYSGVSSVFPRMLAANAPDFSFARSRFDADPSESVRS